MRTASALALVLVAILAPSVAHGQSVVLKMGTLASGAFGAVQDGRVTLTLASGTRIAVPVTDIDIDLTKNLLGGGSPTPAGQSSAVSPGEVLLSPSAQESAIRTKCETEWRSDFQMQAFCMKQQREAAVTLQRRTMSSGDQRTIRSKCSSEWPGDFQMWNFCEEQQLKALAELRR